VVITSSIRISSPAGEIRRASEGSANVPGPFAPGKVGLGGGMADSATTAYVDGHAPGLADRACQFERLIEATLAQALGMQRHGDEQVRRAAPSRLCGELPTEVAAERQAMSILERLNQLVDRKSITKNGQGGVVMRQPRETTAADFATGRRQRAAWTACRRESRQVVLAGRAEQIIATFSAAQQAVLRQQSCARSADQCGALS
jgi:hypothetical protein